MASLMAKVSAVVSPSRYLGDLVVREGMLREYEHIPYGSELEAIPRREGGGPLALGMLAQHAPAKGTHLLLEAARSVPGLDLRLAIFGAGDAAYLRRIRRMASADRRVTVEGPFAPGDVPRILGGIDALAVPSLWPENSPLVIQDALAAGRPCVVPSDSGAAEPVARERYGLCFARGNAASLAAALTRLVGEPGLMDRLRRNIAEDRPVPGRQAVAERYLAVYRKALDRGRPPR